MKESPKSRTTSIDRKIGRKVKAIRTLRGLSLVDIAKEIGVSFQQIQKYEKGLNRISASRLLQIAEELNIEPAELFPDEYQGYDSKHALLLLAEDKQLIEVIKIWQSIDSPKIKKHILELISNLAKFY